MAQELNFTQFISTNATWLTAQQKADLLDDFCLHHGYQATLINELGEVVTNPQSKASFLNEILTLFIKTSVQNGRRQKAIATITVEVIDL